MPDPITNPTRDLEALLAQAFRLVEEAGSDAPEGLAATIQATADVLRDRPDQFYFDTTRLTEARNIVDLVVKQGDVVNQRRAARVQMDITRLLQIDPAARLGALQKTSQKIYREPPVSIDHLSDVDFVTSVLNEYWHGFIVVVLLHFPAEELVAKLPLPPARRKSLLEIFKRKTGYCDDRESHILYRTIKTNILVLDDENAGKKQKDFAIRRAGDVLINCNHFLLMNTPSNTVFEVANFLPRQLRGPSVFPSHGNFWVTLGSPGYTEQGRLTEPGTGIVTLNLATKVSPGNLKRLSGLAGKGASAFSIPDSIAYTVAEYYGVHPGEVHLLNVEPTLAELERQATLAKRKVLSYKGKPDGGGAVMLLFGAVLAAGVPHAHAEEKAPQETIATHYYAHHPHSRKVHSHSHLSANRVFRQRIEVRRHSPAGDLSLTHSPTIWGGGGTALGNSVANILHVMTHFS